RGSSSACSGRTTWGVPRARGSSSRQRRSPAKHCKAVVDVREAQGAFHRADGKQQKPRQQARNGAAEIVPRCCPETQHHHEQRQGGESLGEYLRRTELP